MRVVEAFPMALMTSCVTLLRDHPGEAAEPTRKRGVFPVPDMSPRHAGADPKPPEANLALPSRGQKNLGIPDERARGQPLPVRSCSAIGGRVAREFPAGGSG